MNDLSPSAGATVRAYPLVPQQALEDEEIIIMALKPSLWMVPLACWPILLLAVGAASLLAPPNRPVIVGLALVIVALKACLAILDWLGRLYVLTNRRVLSFYGLLRPRTEQCRLEHLQDLKVASAFDERLIRVGSLRFLGGERPRTSWDYLRHPDRLRQDVLDAIARYRP